jgi:hypothetical protein
MDRTYKSENRIQQECYMWFHNTYPHLRGLLFAVPNGGARSITEGKLFKQTGVVAGVSDMILLYDATPYCFELKTILGSQSQKQKEWQAKVESQFISYYVIRSLNEFQTIVKTIIHEN